MARAPDVWVSRAVYYRGKDIMGKLKQGKGSYRLGYGFRTQRELHLMLLPGTACMIIFSVVPLFGLIIAFTDFKATMGWTGIFTSKWNDFRNFRMVFASSKFFPMLRNTLGINIFGQLVCMPAAIIFALLLNEIRNMKFKFVVQTAAYLPHFLSWAIFGGLVKTLLTADGGAINKILMDFSIIGTPKEWLADPAYFWAICISSGLIKDLGWSAIIYLAAIAGVDPTLYEVVEIDGGNRFHKMWYVTIPAIKPTIMVMMIFAVSGILNNNFTQIYVLQNSLNMSASNVIDTYIYQVGMQQFQFGVATSAGLVKSVLALLLLSFANWASKKLTDSGLY